MNKRIPLYLYLFIIFLLFFVVLGGNKMITVISESAPISNRTCYIIDAGHGGVDGGATSCTGVLESALNLEIALRLDDLMHLMGMETKMIRTTDCSVHTKDGSIAEKKISDLKERVRIANSTENAIVISIHQNYFIKSQYSGAQVFYNDQSVSKEIATILQNNLNAVTNSKRNIKKADGVYFMDNVQCPGILLECGFLSNPQEESRLRDANHQKLLCSVIVSSVSCYMQQKDRYLTRE